MSSEKKFTFQDCGEKERFLHECLRYRGLLYQIAERVLEGPEGAEDAVNRSLALATRTPKKRRTHTGDFRSWLLRIVIDEALQILRARKGPEQLAPEAELALR